jgi:hypothetical protein
MQDVQKKSGDSRALDSKQTRKTRSDALLLKACSHALKRPTHLCQRHSVAPCTAQLSIVLAQAVAIPHILHLAQKIKCNARYRLVLCSSCAGQARLWQLTAAVSPDARMCGPPSTNATTDF